MPDSIQTRLLIADIKLLHMKIYADCMRQVVLRGLHHVTVKDILGGLEEIADDQKMVKLASEIYLDQAIKGSNAARLIFMHAGVEACLFSLIRATTEKDPEAFASLLVKREFKLNFGDYLNKERKTLIQEQNNKFLESIERQPLAKHAILLTRFLKRAPTMMSRYDQKRVERIENIRNDCAHGRVDVTDFSVIDDDIDYLFQMGEGFIEACAAHWDIQSPRAAVREDLKRAADRTAKKSTKGKQSSKRKRA